MATVSPFRVTPEDLQTLKPDVLEGLAPLLDALNVTLPQLVAAVQGLPRTESLAATFIAESTATAYVQLSTTLTTRLESIQVDHIRRVDGAPMALPYSMTWTVLDKGPRLLFAGLDPFAKYSIGVTLR
jgi:hypothetical protein